MGFASNGVAWRPIFADCFYASLDLHVSLGMCWVHSRECTCQHFCSRDEECKGEKSKHRELQRDDSIHG